MLKEERLQKIINLVEENKFMSVSNMSNILDVTEMTIRRDLIELEELNLIKRVHGGARINNNYFDRQDAYIKTIKSNSKNKKIIAKIAADSIKDNDVIFIGAGTTTYYLTDYIKAKNIVVVTNSQQIIEKLWDNQEVKLICTGGTYRGNTRSFIGPISERIILNMRFNKIYLGTNGIDKNNIYTSSYEASILYKTALNNSTNRYILADSSKFNRLDFVSFYETKDISIIITDDELPELIYKKYNKSMSILTPSIYKKSEK
ncbi:DeoR/GlpR family DNA-binding transcription regulator [Helcococcus ovis]|uniref:DeoR/GlpR family DNA-binding transcription regulator n=3 Tax=Helcococcus ovis TaxID=72026 RepID=UPI0010700294|nr:DeoR/GlpR family DNA-binding transcription regulator [Helcococcus ovis]TFF68785.1 DeoR/GlpR transcriptional regulator [Helcococcus ovis]WNZ01197.1 DeoR/GlpR family DNA-binding transcription regulator [Helcococcus ovis]